MKSRYFPARAREEVAVPNTRETLKDAASIAVGLGVLGYQRAQVRRREMAKALRDPDRGLEARLEGVRQELARVVQVLDGTVLPLIEQLDTRLDELEELLPNQARDTVHELRAQARQAGDTLVGHLRGVA